MIFAESFYPIIVCLDKLSIILLMCILCPHNNAKNNCLFVLGLEMCPFELTISNNMKVEIDNLKVFETI